ncbi:MAG: MBL fold metallo-hydrolase, partial [Candidatus Helarchaeota archaeon]
IKFGSLPVEYGESINSKLYDIGVILGKMGDSSVTLIEYKNDYFLVDTGFANESNLSFANLKYNEHLFKNMLDVNGLSFDDISGIFITHWHGDHFGNLRLFKDTNLYCYLPDNLELHLNKKYDHIIIKQFKPNIEMIAKYYHFEHLLPIIKLNEKDTFAGCKIFPTPGHTLYHCSLLTEYMNQKIVIAGDAIVSQSYYDHNEVWQYNSGNLGKENCIQSMNKIIDIADMIIPGHGHPFQNYKKKSI